MKFRIVMAALVVMGATAGSFAQTAPTTTGERRTLTEDELLQRQSNQIIGALGLDDATASKFVPVFKDYKREMRECLKVKYQARELRRANRGASTAPTDEEVEQRYMTMLKQNEKMLATREKYYKEFRRFLSPKQIVRIYQIEKKNGGKYKKEWNKRKQKRNGMRCHKGK